MTSFKYNMRIIFFILYLNFTVFVQHIKRIHLHPIGCGRILFSFKMYVLYPFVSSRRYFKNPFNCKYLFLGYATIKRFPTT